MELTKATRNDFSTHKSVDLKNDNNIKSLLFTNIRIWKYL